MNIFGPNKPLLSFLVSKWLVILYESVCWIVMLLVMFEEALHDEGPANACL